MIGRTIPTLEEIAAGTAWRNFATLEVDAELAAVLIVHNRRLDALEQQARPEQEDGHLAVGEERWRTFQGPELFPEAMRGLRRRAEAAERERDEANRQFCAEERNHHVTIRRVREVTDDLEMARSVERDTRAGRDAALATVERLRDALDGAETFVESVTEWTGSSPDDRDETLDIIRRALKETP